MGSFILWIPTEEHVTLRKFPLAPMGVLVSGSAHARPSAQPPIATSGNLSVHMSGRGGQNYWNNFLINFPTKS